MAVQTRKIKTIAELQRLPTKRLLAYLKAERLRLYRAGFICGCCDEFMWDISDKHAYMKKEYEDWKAYLDLIKSLLNKRGHVHRN